jgi:hypothetical protein
MFILPPETWEAIRDMDVADLLDAIEVGGIEAGERWLRSRGLAFSRPGGRVAERPNPEHGPTARAEG